MTNASRQLNDDDDDNDQRDRVTLEQKENEATGTDRQTDTTRHLHWTRLEAIDIQERKKICYANEQRRILFMPEYQYLGKYGPRITTDDENKTNGNSDGYD